MSEQDLTVHLHLEVDTYNHTADALTDTVTAVQRALNQAIGHDRYRVYVATKSGDRSRSEIQVTNPNPEYGPQLEVVGAPRSGVLPPNPVMERVTRRRRRVEEPTDEG